jgi:hypothetical protein
MRGPAILQLGPRLVRILLPIGVLGVCLATPSASSASIVIADASSVEGDVALSDLFLTVTSDSVAGVDWKTVARGTGLQDAQPSLDYVEADGQLLFPAAGSQTIGLQLIGEYDDEEDEYFDVVLTDSVSGAFLAQAAIGILDDDASIGVGSVFMDEGAPGSRPSSSRSRPIE